MNPNPLLFVILFQFILIIALDPNILPDFSSGAGSQGIDIHAVPNVIISGVAKGGSTDIWNLIETFDGDFVAKSGPGKDLLMLEKEFNLPFISGDYINHKSEYPCPAETMTMLLKCPSSIMQNDHGQEHNGRNLTKCAKWLSATPEKTHATRIAPKYTMDAYPYLMRNNHKDMKNILLLNSPNPLCSHSTPSARRPLIISLVRDPLARVVSYYNYFILRSAAVPLEEMLEGELNVLENSPRLRPFLRVLETINSTAFSGSRDSSVAVSAREAHFIIHAYERLRMEIKQELGFQKKNKPDKNFEPEGVLLDNIYLPQILGILFPVHPSMIDDREGEEKEAGRKSGLWSGERVVGEYPLLVLQSELLFAHMQEVFEEVLVPFFYVQAEDRNRILQRAKSSSSKVGDVYTNSKGGKYSPLCTLSKPMQCRVYRFYYKLNRAFVHVVHRLQQSGRILAAPRVHAEDLWWGRSLEGCNVDRL